MMDARAIAGKIWDGYSTMDILRLRDGLSYVPAASKWQDLSVDAQMAMETIVQNVVDVYNGDTMLHLFEKLHDINETYFGKRERNYEILRQKQEALNDMLALYGYQLVFSASCDCFVPVANVYADRIGKRDAEER